MNRGYRELLGPGRLVLNIRGCPGPPTLRFETAEQGLLLRQGERPLLLGRTQDKGCCKDLAMHRLDGFRSPLPHLRSDAMREGTDWTHQYARWLEETADGPLHDGRWHITRRASFAPGIWTEDFVRDWPGGSLELYCGGGWHGVLPLRSLSPPDAPRVKAYRKHARDGTLAPVLLWWVTFLDGWLILDGHDRAMAALAEGAEPVCVELKPVADEERWRATADEITTAHGQHMARLDSCAPHPNLMHQRAALERGYADVIASLPYDTAHTASWALPGGAAAWDDLAARAMFQFPRD
ncbi:hypothetical protein SAMN04487981_109259 [Streptomyces sp. cf386]|uniref:hypothetical protein n=1 Tax=Streptomyces sp. cf386 TaxID=1761904 RepID=UPI000890ECDD|nr:hypothetical protein [Streptomyces sp. cf386]SDO25578.1 hypothetical protein SAMN04487981_109259 [Streptomyces sp. cf386]